MAYLGKMIRGGEINIGVGGDLCGMSSNPIKQMLSYQFAHITTEIDDHRDHDDHDDHADHDGHDGHGLIYKENQYNNYN